jgi:subtilisin family serine protease
VITSPGLRATLERGLKIKVCLQLKAFLLALAMLATAERAAAQGIAPADYPGPMQTVQPTSPAKTPTDIYIVQLADSAAATYKGGTLGFGATKPAPGRRLNASDPAVESYVRYLEQSQDALLAATGGEKIHSFRYALNGFAGRLTPEQVTRLAHRPEVVGIWRDSVHTLQTNNSSLFLGLLDQVGGLRADIGLTGEDIVIGVIDSGIDPRHPQLQDFEEHIPRTCRSAWAEASWLGFLLCNGVLRNPPTAKVYDPVDGFNGICAEGPGFPADSCNNKLVGARFYLDGFLQRYDQTDPGEFFSPKDADGHGTHIATIIAGNPAVADIFGARVGETSGLAPRARIAVYKACWLRPGEGRASCATSDLARAIDDAVADGVDLINYSVGSLETDLTAPEDLALLNAAEAGVLSIVAAGNDGPNNYTIGSPSSAPWVLTVGASTQSGTRSDQAIEVTAPPALTDRLPMREASFTPRLETLEPLQAKLILVDDAESTLADGGLGSIHDACEALVNGDELGDAIALVERGGCTFQAKIEHAEAAGAIGAVIYNPTGDPFVMNGTQGSVGIPAVMIGPADGAFLVDAIFAGDEPEVRMAYGLLVTLRETGDVVTSWSSRGPSLSENDFIKPDLVAPGQNILAGSTPDIANGTRGEYYQYLSGTSMATPMVAGIAALLKEARPDFTPGMLKSALMTTALRDLVVEDGEFVANPFDMGSGRVNGNAALDPGLVVDTRHEDYVAYLCGTDTPVVSNAECAALIAAGFSLVPEQLNLPSIGVNELIPGDEIVRRLTNVGPASTYDLLVDAPPGIAVTAEPSTLALASGESAEIRLRFDITDAPYDFWQFGNLDLADGTRTANLPIAVQPVYLRAPRDIHLTELEGADSLPVDFGYTGSYYAGAHGLNSPGLHEAGFVDDDPTNTFSFRFDNGVRGHFFTLSANEVFLRVALFDALTDGEDDLDLYLYHCPTLSSCVEVGQSGSFTSEEEIDVLQPEPGLYAALVHGFQTDQTSGGPGADYELLAWSFGLDDEQGNLSIEAPDSVSSGARLDLPYEFGPLDPATIYLGAVSHDTPFDVFFLTIITANKP